MSEEASELSSDALSPDSEEDTELTDPLKEVDTEDNDREDMPEDSDEPDEPADFQSAAKDKPVEKKNQELTLHFSKKMMWVLGIVLALGILGVLTWQLRWYQPLYAVYNRGTISIKIKEDDKFAIEGAMVVINGQSYTTDSSGKITLLKLAAGTYTMTVNKDGYDPLEQSITVKRGDNDAASISIRKTPTKLYVLSGVVRDYVSNSVVADAQITISGVTKKTNQNGEFTFDKLAPDDYKAVVSKSGYRDQELSVAVANQDISEQKVLLVPVGQHIFVSNRNGKRSLYVTNYDGSEQRQFVTPENEGEDFGPQISADNKWVVFSSTRDHVKSTYGKDLSKLYIVDRDGKEVKKINDDVSHSEARWSPNSKFLYFVAYSNNQENQTTRRFYDVGKGSVVDLGDDGVSELNFSNDGNMVIYTVAKYGEGGSPEYTNYLKILNLVNGDRVTLVTKTGSSFGVPRFAADDKTVSYEMIVNNVRKRYELANTGGTEKEVSLPTQDNRTYYASPDGNWKAFVEKRDGKQDLFIVDKAGKNEKKLTTLGVINNTIPIVWDESSRYLTFAINREAENALYIVSQEGGEAKKVTDFSDSSDYPQYY